MVLYKEFEHVNQCLIESLGGIHNIAAYAVEENNIYILIYNIKLLPNRIVDFDSYGTIWINDNLVNLKVTFDTQRWINVFDQLFPKRMLKHRKIEQL